MAPPPSATAVSPLMMMPVKCLFVCLPAALR